MATKVAIVSIIITFILIFLLNREGRRAGLSVGPLGGFGLAVVVVSFVALGFYIKGQRDLETVRVTKLIPLEKAYCLSGLPDTLSDKIFGIMQLAQGISESRLEEGLREVYSTIPPSSLIEWAIHKIDHLKSYSAGPEVHDLTLDPKMGPVEQVHFHTVIDAHAIPRQIALLDIILDTYIGQQRTRYQKAGSDKEIIKREFDQHMKIIKDRLSGINLEAKPWSRLTLQDSLQ